MDQSEPHVEVNFTRSAWRYRRSCLDHDPARSYDAWHLPASGPSCEPVTLNAILVSCTGCLPIVSAVIILRVVIPVRMAVINICVTAGVSWYLDCLGWRLLLMIITNLVFALAAVTVCSTHRSFAGACPCAGPDGLRVSACALTCLCLRICVVWYCRLWR
jgi:type IV secretory pathway VirB2 component (pilin)